MYIHTSLLSLFAIVAQVTLPVEALHTPPHLRHAIRNPIRDARYDAILPRADDQLTNDTLQSASVAPTTTDISTSIPADSAIAASATTTSDVPSGKAGDIIAPESTSSTPSSTVVQSSVPASTTSTDDSNTAVAVDTSSSSQVAVSPSAIVQASNVVPTINAPLTTDVASQIMVTSRQQRISVTTQTHTASATASMVAQADDTSASKSGGLSKTALIAIIVVASVAGLGAAAVFAIRKWKLKPSHRFDERMKPISFSPSGNDGMDDVFLEKTLHRTASNELADKQRQQFVKELEADPSYIAGIPEHDFTATASQNYAGYGAMGYQDDMYNSDPFAHAQAFEYDPDAYYVQPEQYADIPSTHATHDYATQDVEQGYANLHRGSSNGSDHRPHRPLSGGYANGRVSPDEFPSADQYLGRPTGGSDGPYAQAAQYRDY